MDVRHKQTSKVQKISKEDWAKLVETKHSANFETVNGEDFTPPEAKVAATNK